MVKGPSRAEKKQDSRELEEKCWEFLQPFLEQLHGLVDRRINDIVHGRRRVKPSTALRLAKFFNMSTDFWMNLQMQWDMYYAQQEETAILFFWANDLLRLQVQILTR